MKVCSSHEDVVRATDGINSNNFTIPITHQLYDSYCSSQKSCHQQWKKDHRVAVGFVKSGKSLQYDITINYETDDEGLVDWEEPDKIYHVGNPVDNILNPLHRKAG